MGQQPLRFCRSHQLGVGWLNGNVQQLDSKRGVLLTTSYEFPGRYARWSLGFVDPSLELSGKDNHCTIGALNERGRILMPSILRAMNQLQDEGALETIETTTMDDDVLTQLDVTVVPPPEVGTFDEEERSRQVSRKCVCVFVGH